MSYILENYITMLMCVPPSNHNSEIGQLQLKLDSADKIPSNTVFTKGWQCSCEHIYMIHMIYSLSNRQLKMQLQT